MTFCLGIKLADGLVGIADTRVLSGNEMVVARKVSVYQEKRRALFLMTAGLRSLRDKAVTYFEESMAQHEEPLDHLFKAVNLFAVQVRRVAQEDRGSLQESGLTFDFSALIGGQFEHDKEHKLFLVYPQGNWIEIGQGTPIRSSAPRVMANRFLIARSNIRIRCASLSKSAAWHSTPLE